MPTTSTVGVKKRGRPPKVVVEEEIKPKRKYTRSPTADFDKSDPVLPPVSPEELASPQWMNLDSSEEFLYLKEQMAIVGLNTDSYSLALSLFAEKLKERNELKRRAYEAGGPSYIGKSTRYGHSDEIHKANPLYRAFVDAEKDLIRFLVEFGLTPNSRARVMPVTAKLEDKEDNPFEALMSQ